MEDFVKHAEVLLQGILAREALPSNGYCQSCDKQRRAVWKCKDCSIPLLQCRFCMRHSHLSNPFHHIECWTGNFFRPAQLWEVGSYILVTHHMQAGLCDTLSTQKRILEREQLPKDEQEQVALDTASAYGPAPALPALHEASGTSSTNISDNGGDDSELGGDAVNADIHHIEGYLGSGGQSDAIVPTMPATPHRVRDVPKHDILHNHYVRIIHTNGIHQIAVATCISCRGTDNVHTDLAYCNLIPASFSKYETMFTVDVLDDFRLSNLECKVSAYQYFQKLRRQSCPTAPATTGNFYQELLRMSRLWRWLKKKKWAGHGHRNQSFHETLPGELANFCPACPQPGINLPPNWMDDIGNKWVYRRFFVADGNFKADHVRQKGSSDFWLSEGSGMFTTRKAYDSFLSVAVERLTVSGGSTYYGSS